MRCKIWSICIYSFSKSFLDCCLVLKDLSKQSSKREEVVYYAYVESHDLIDFVEPNPFQSFTVTFYPK